MSFKPLIPSEIEVDFRGPRTLKTGDDICMFEVVRWISGHIFPHPSVHIFCEYCRELSFSIQVHQDKSIGVNMGQGESR